MAARLSTTSEGLWLTAALAGVTRLPAVLKVRPVGDVEGIVSGHPGLAVLEEAGVCRNGVLDPDVEDWLLTLGRPDVELNVKITRPDDQPGRLVGPAPLFIAPSDPVEAAEALYRSYAEQPAQRAAALCRRNGWWVAAARMWQPGAGRDGVDDIVVTPLGQSSVTAAVNDIVGAGQATQFEGINIEAAVLQPFIEGWLAAPQDTNVVADLVDVGLTPAQARMVEAVGDASTTRAVVTAVQYSIDGPSLAPTSVTVADTLLGRVLISNCTGPDGRVWTMLFPGTAQRVANAVDELLEALPAGTTWATHRRIRKFATH